MKTLILNIARLFMILALIAVIIGMSGVTSVASASQNYDASCWISASPTTISKGGSTTLSWGSSNGRDGWISDIGDVPASGSRVVYNLDEDTKFTYTVYDDNGSETCETKVYVRGGVSHGSNKAPGCTIWRENNAWGSGVSLRWNSTEATSAFLSSVGSVSTFGTYTVYPPTYGTTYTLTVYGNGQSRQCQLEVYPSTNTYYQTPHTYYGSQYQAPYVYLTQIPYTGVDLGVVGSVIYFLGLALFAISGSYLLSYYQGGIFRLSFAGEVKAAMRNQTRSLVRLFRN